MTLLVFLSGCNRETIVFSGTYINVENNSEHLVFTDSEFSLYNIGIIIRSGTYKIDAAVGLMIENEGFRKRFAFNESHDTLYHGNYALDNAGEIAFY
jgi:hypothetical protein